MINFYVPGFSKPKSADNRRGDAQIISDGANHLVIDGYCDDGTDLLISYLKAAKMTTVYGLISHWHYDHYHGIEEIIKSSAFKMETLYCPDPASLNGGLNGTRYSGEVKSEINAGNRIVKEAKSKGIRVVYLKTGDVVQIGEIRFKVWRQQPTTLRSDDTEAWSFINDGSICCYFPDLYYLTTGDGPDNIRDAAAYFNAPIKWFKIPHHGNNCNQSNTAGLVKAGAVFCWYNGLEPGGVGTTGFTAYGAKRCKEAGLTVWDAIGSISGIAAGNTLTLRQGSKTFTIAVPYSATVPEGWIKNNKGRWYRYPNATWAVGWKKLTKDGKTGWYYFDSDGYMVTGWAKVNGYWYYLDPKTGAMRTGWLDYKGRKCYLEPDPAKNEGHAYCNEIATIDGKTYRFDKDCYATEIDGDTNKEEEIETNTQTNKTPKLRDMKELKLIDVSEHNGTINWEKAAKEIDGAIIRCGYGQNKTSQDDKQFRRNVSECTRLGIPFGIYLYSYATSGSAGGGEADHALRCAKGLELSYPIYFDSEDASTKAAAYNAAITFGNKIEAAGYWCGLYSGEYFYNANLRGISRFTKWIAKYGSNDGKPHSKPNVSDVAIWQYTSRGKVSGISGYVDMNICYKDLVKSVTGKDYIQAARDVWAGKYGSGDKRVAALKKAGFDPRIVQHYVNRMA